MEWTIDRAAWWVESPILPEAILIKIRSWCRRLVSTRTERFHPGDRNEGNLALRFPRDVPVTVMVANLAGSKGPGGSSPCN